MTGRPRLIHLNGPAAAGKSTIAQRYVEDHPLALNLDIDTIRALLGRWMDDQESSGLRARRLAIAMARAHLADGHDVVVPQLVARTGFVEQLAQVADEVHAEFIEVFVMVDKEVSRRRTASRVDPSVPGRFNPAELVAHNGGAEALDVQHDGLMSFLAGRRTAVVVDAGEMDRDAAYAAVLESIGNGNPSTGSGLAD